jgi:hypothetical protein
MKDIALGRQNKHQVFSTCLHFVLEILCIGLHTATSVSLLYVSAYCYVCVLMLLKHQVVSTWMAIMTPVLKTCADKSRQIIAQMERFFQVQTPQLVLVLRSCTVKRSEVCRHASS